jgi:MFS family permease
MRRSPPLSIWGDILNRRFVTQWVISFCSGALTAPTYSLLAIYVESVLHRPPLFSAGLRASLLVLGGFVSILGGALSDSFGRKQTYLLGMTGSVISGLLFYSESPLVLVALCVYNGICFGFLTTASQSYMMDAVSGRSLGLGAAIYFIGSTLGSSLGNLVLAPLADTLGFRSMGGIMVGGMSVLFVGTVLLLPGGRPEGLSVSRHSFRKTMGGYSGLFRQPTVLMLMGVRYLPTCYWGAATLLIPLLIYRATGTNASAAHYSAVSLVVAACFQVAVGRLCDRYGRRWPILIASAAVTLSALGAGLFVGSFIGLYVFGVIGAASAWSLSTTMPGLMNDIAGEEEKGRVVGAAHLAWSLGMTCGNLGGGGLVDLYPPLPFYVVTGFCAVSFLLARGICRRVYPVRGR